MIQPGPPAIRGAGLQHIGRAGHSPGPAGSREAAASNVAQTPGSAFGNTKKTASKSGKPMETFHAINLI